ncbi:hypothetical protein [Marinactinospora rubrisoli]|uniref:Uncharacterized protein n=1 Tax=Marinactinospora rubrisoli TaxID=2715399 RepID=A0ABW2KDQ1_9ACTN
MADHGIVPGRSYHLLYANRGVGLEVVSNWDWVRLSRKADGPWHTVTFHEYEGDRYVIEHGDSHWDGHKYWHMCSGGVCLNKWGPSTAWTIYPTKNGFVLGKGEELLRAKAGDKQWLAGHDATTLLGKLTGGLADIGDCLRLGDGEGGDFIEFQATPA